MRQSRNLCKRGHIYYFRFATNACDVKLSLGTSNYYEARHLRDKNLSDLSVLLMGNDILGQIKHSELLKNHAKDILEKEKARNDGVLDLSNTHMDEYLPLNRRIKDQEFLTQCLRKRIVLLERERLRNDGRLPDYMIDDLTLWSHPEVLNKPISSEELDFFENAPRFPPSP